MTMTCGWASSRWHAIHIEFTLALQCIDNAILTGGKQRQPQSTQRHVDPLIPGVQQKALRMIDPWTVERVFIAVGTSRRQGIDLSPPIRSTSKISRFACLGEKSVAGTERS